MSTSRNSLLNPFSLGMAGSGIGGLLSGFFNDSSQPYKKAGNEIKKYSNTAAGYQVPFYNMGTSAIPSYEDWVKSMSNPSEYINNLTKQYTTSPQEEYAQQQALRAATNMGSATGMTGSTPLQLQAQENAGNIANKYMEDWLREVLGINTQYGRGLESEIGRGQMSANELTRIYENLARQMSEMAYGQNMAKVKQNSDIFSTLGALGGGLIGGLFL